MQKSCILIVDKDKSFVTKARNLLYRKGYAVFKAEDAKEALEKCENHPPDIVLIDEHLAHVDGQNLCDEIKQLLPDEFIPIIVLLRIQGLNPESQYLKWGADQCVHKRSGMKKFVSHLHAMLRIRQRYSHLEGIKAYNEEISTNIPVSILILTQGQKIKFANKHFCNKMHLDAAEIIGDSLNRVLTFPIYESLRLSESIREVRFTSQPSRGYKISYGGTYYFYKLLPIIGKRSEKPDIMLMMQDVTDVEELAKELRKSEERYRNLFRNSVEPIAMVDLDGEFIMINERMCSLFGYSRRMLLKKNISQLIFDEDVELFEKPFQSALAGRQASASVRMVTKKRDLRHVEVSIKQIVGKDEKLIQIIMRDVTRRLELEEQLKQSEKMSALGQFTAGATHEINNPLSIISSYVQYLLSNLDSRKSKQLKPKEVKEINKTLKIINKETQRCGRIVNNLLQFSRKAKVEFEQIDINEILGKTLTLLGRQLKFSGITINKKLVKKLPKVKGNYNLLHQVFMNLILNARAAMPEGGRLLVKTGRNKRRIEVEIRDKGKGIPKEDLNKIFNPFYTTKDVGGGIGLGLSVVHSIVKDHGGSISVKSKMGEGTSFSIRLPVRRSALRIGVRSAV